MNEESIGLLQACDSGTKTGMNSIRAVLDKVQDVAFDEIAQLQLADGTQRLARVVEVEQDKAVLQVFEGTKGAS